MQTFKMTATPPTSSSTHISTYVRNNFSQFFCIIVLVIVVFATFGLQNTVVGLEGGYDDYQPKHHGWVSANTLAIISKATPENYFVGYVLASVDDKRKVQYE